MQKQKLGPIDILFPIPAALIVSGDEKKPNIMTVSWIGMMSIKPPILAISIHKSRYSFELITKYEDFSVNIPSASMYKEVDYCGLVSGKNTSKLDKVKFDLIKSENINTPIIKQCPFNLECKVIKTVPISEHTTIFGQILETYIDEDKVENKSPKKIDIQKVDPLIYCATVGQYWNIGKKLGNSFSAGAQIKAST
jgi:flavin reductase (DIM6/NTAB) family NADH-FMN oxidoreductase RutF